MGDRLDDALSAKGGTGHFPPVIQEENHGKVGACPMLDAHDQGAKSPRRGSTTQLPAGSAGGVSDFKKPWILGRVPGR